MAAAAPTDPPPAHRAPAAPARLPRWLLALVVPLAAVGLVGLFVFLRFPFDRFGDVLARQTGEALGAEVALGELYPRWTVAGPGLVARAVAIRWPDGSRARVEEASLRPAWSLAWLEGSAALRLDAASDIGAIAGTLSVGAAPGFEGRLEGVKLARLPLDRFAAGASLDGTLDLQADLHWRARRPVGDARFAARDGSLAAPSLPIALPYDALHGRIRFGDDGAVALEDVSLEGPMVSAQAHGGTGPGPSLWLAPLRLDVHLEVSDRNLRPTFRSAGLALGPDGSVELRVRGNLAAPVVR